MAQMTDEQLRESFSEIPSDLPTNVPKHPGKPINRRFESEKFPRQIISAPILGVGKLASELNFNPVTTMNIADRNVHVKPVNNMHSRVISPPDKEALNLLIRGEKVIGDSTEVQEQVQRRIDQKLKQLFAGPKSTSRQIVSPLPEKQKLQSPKPPVAPGTRPATPASVTTTQKIVPVPTGENFVSPQSTPTPTATVAPTSTPSPTVTKTPSAPSVTPHLTTERSTEPGAIQLKAEVGTLRKLLNQADVDKTVSQRRVIELTNKYQSQMAAIVQEKKQINSQLTELRNKLMEETKRRLASENSHVVATNQLKTELNKMKIERDGHLGKLKEAQDKITLMRDQQAKATEASVVLTQLKAKLAQIEKEKDEVDKKSIKLEALVSDLQKLPNQTTVTTKEMVIPKEADGKAKDAPIRIVHPVPAIGKMAPQLTTVPNVVNGIIKNTNGLLLSNVVLVVKDSVGNSVRALKSNKIGQFAVSTPLPNGTYTMELEKEGDEFDTVQINLEGEVLLPIEIRAR